MCPKFEQILNKLVTNKKSCGIIYIKMIIHTNNTSNGGRYMSVYVYEAVDANGKNKKGSLEADTPELAASMLKADGLDIISIKEGSLLNKDLNFGGKKKVTPRDMSVFCKQFVSILAAGVTVINALEMLAEQSENPTLQEALKDVMLSVQKGETLASAMAENPDVFPSILVNMVSAGEASGSLEIAFDRMSTHFEKDNRIKAMVKKAMIYPVVVLVVMVIVIVAMLVLVIPSFETMFADMGMELPFMTRMVVAMSNFLQTKWYIVVAFIAALIVGFKMFKSTDYGVHALGKFKMKAPIVGNMTVKGACSRFARTISTLMAAGLPLIECIDITAKTMDNIWFKEALLDAKEQVARGVALSTPLVESGLFPAMICQMTRIGEETGNVEEMLTKVADYYDEEVEIATQSISSAMEPIIIVVLALIVGVMVMAIMTPMFSMYSGIDNL